MASDRSIPCTRTPRALKGRVLPAIGRIEISVIEEQQPRWLAFLRRVMDYLQPFPLDFVGERKTGIFNFAANIF